MVPSANDLAIKERSNAYASIASSGKFVVVAWGATTQDGRTDLYAATSHDGGGTFAAPVRVNATAGEANFSGERPSGVVYAAWRQVYEGNVRDIAFTRSSDGGRTFTTPLRISDDNWVLDGCPENGPAMAVDRAGRIHVVWPTLVPGPTAQSSPTLALFYATSDDRTRFTPRQQIPTEGVPRHAQLILGRPGQLLVAWDEQAGGSRSIAIARGVVDSRGTARFNREKIATEGSASYPVLARTDGATIVGWTGAAAAAQTVIRVKRLTD